MEVSSLDSAQKATPKGYATWLSPGLDSSGHAVSVQGRTCDASNPGGTLGSQTPGVPAIPSPRQPTTVGRRWMQKIPLSPSTPCR